MSHFLQNLITRHQVNGVLQKDHQIVQPRPRSRFEADSSAGENFTQYASDTETVTTTTNKQSSFNPNLVPRHQTNADTINPTADHQTSDASELISALIPPSEPRAVSHETTNFTNKDRSRQQKNGESESASIIEQLYGQETNNQELSPGGELNQRIQTILHRFNHQHSQRADKQSSSALPQHTEFSNTAAVLGKNVLTGSEEIPIDPEQVISFETKNSAQKQNNENRATQRETHHTGLLKTPDWLTEVQSVLKSRLREINAQEKSEQVVNVTIGRVEVRAVQTDSIKQPKPQNKPRGIMSLDDYLNQRNKGNS